MNTNVLLTEDEATYHSRSKSGEYVSSHMLAVFQKMPYKYKSMISGEFAEPEKMEYAFGTAAHKMILEGHDAFFEKYIVSDGPINEKTGQPYGKTTKAYQEWISSQTGEVISSADFDEIKKMHESCLRHPIIPELLRPDAMPEKVVRAEINGVKCQIRMDLFHADLGIIDLKTCRDIEFFEYDMRNFGYAFQLAFYRSVLKAATGIDFPVKIIAVDKTQFHIAGVWSIPDAELEIAERINAAALDRLKDCRINDQWKTGFERIQIFSINK